MCYQKYKPCGKHEDKNEFLTEETLWKKVLFSSRDSLITIISTVVADVYIGSQLAIMTN